MEFEVKGIIAEGGFGRVVEAMVISSTVLEEAMRWYPVAIKVYNKRSLEHSGESLTTEVDIGAWLAHLHITSLTRLWSVFEDESNVYLVMVSRESRAPVQCSVSDTLACRITTPRP